MATLYRKQGQSQVVDQQGNLQSFSGNLDTLPIYNQGNTITTAQLKPEIPMVFPNQQYDPSGADAMASGAQSRTNQFDADYQRFYDASVNQQGENNLSFLLNDYLKTAEGNVGQGASQLQAEQQLGIPELQKQRATSSGAIKTALAEYNALRTQFEQQKADLEVGTRGNGNADIRASMLYGQQGAVDRAKLAALNSKAADIGILQAQDLALAGNIEAAQKTADRAVDLMYKDKESLLATKKLQYEMYKDILDRTDSKRSKALEYAFNKEEQMLSEEKDLKKSLQELSFNARKNGAPDSTIGAISRAKNFEEAVIAMGRYIREPVKASAPSAPIIKSINGVDMQWDAKSGKWISPTGITGSSADTTQDTLNKFKFIRDTATEANRLAGSSGKSGLRRTFGNLFVGDSKYNQLEAHINTLKTNMLTLATDPNIKKFFGPQMSNADVELMVSAGTTLNPKFLSEKQMRTEIKRIDDFINRAQTAVQMGQSGRNIITAPDGTQIEIIN